MTAKKKKTPATATKKPKKVVAPAPLSKAEAFFVEAHLGKLSAEEIAAELGADRRSVDAYLEALDEAGVKPAQERSPIEKAGFAVHNGTVSMTVVGAEKGDASTADAAKRPFHKRDGIHVIDPKRPVF